MPPCSLHHFVNASAVSNSSWLRPRRPEKPGSEIVDTCNESAVTPGSVPAAFSSSAGAGEQTTPRSPKAPWSRPGLPAFAAVVPELGADVAVAPAVVSLSRPHAAAIRSAASVRINRRFDMVEHLRVRSCGIPNRPRDPDSVALVLARSRETIDRAQRREGACPAQGDRERRGAAEHDRAGRAEDLAGHTGLERAQLVRRADEDRSRPRARGPASTPA